MAALRFNTSLLLFLLFLIIPLLSNSSGGIIVESFKVDSMLPKYSLQMDGEGMKMRKLMSFEHSVLDYDDAGPNPKHDPPKKKPGPGGKP